MSSRAALSVAGPGWLGCTWAADLRAWAWAGDVMAGYGDGEKLMG